MNSESPPNRYVVTFRVALAALAALAILYAGDYASIKYRVTRAGNAVVTPAGPLESVQVQQTYEIPHKDGRAEFAFAQPQNVTCARSIFPHLGYSPCWYVKRHTQQVVPM